jgi:hypothetical protein
VGDFESPKGTCFDPRWSLLIRPVTLNRLLKQTRPRDPAKSLCGTRCGRHLKAQIPIRTDNREIERPGLREADTVAHCGTSLAGSFIRSFIFTNIFSQWTENRAVWNKGLPTSWPRIWPLSEVGPPDGHGRVPHRHGRCCDGRFRTAGDGVTRRCSYCFKLAAFLGVSRHCDAERGDW